MNYKKILALPMLAILTACGSSSSDTDIDTDIDTEIVTEIVTEAEELDILTGTFVDSAVINIAYKTATQEGVTNEDGEYNYVEGETVTFFIGDLVLPSVRATGIVTPLDLADTTDTADYQVVNILRLLQTLDQDGDPDNGITITKEAKDVAQVVDFDVSTAVFSQLDAVIDLISNAGLDTAVTELVSSSDAIAHFEGELITLENTDNLIKTFAGTWTLSEESQAGHETQLLSYTFFKDGSYLNQEIGINEVNLTESSDEDYTDVDTGAEWATYSYDEESGALSIGDTYVDYNADLGLIDADGNSATVVAEVLDDILTMQITRVVDEQEQTETLTFDRLISDGLVGTWYEPDWEPAADVQSATRGLSEPDYEVESVSLFADGTYLYTFGYDYGYLKLGKSIPSLSMEWGSYERDETSGELAINIEYADSSYVGLSAYVESDTDSLAIDLDDDMLVLSVYEDGELDSTGTFYNEYMTIAVDFTADFFSGNTLDLSFSESISRAVVSDSFSFDEAGTGTITIDGDTNDITWSINDGNLVFTEVDSDDIEWSWTLDPTEIDADSGDAEATYTITSDGQETLSGTVSIGIEYDD